MDWDWFDWGKHESRLAKYWASEEMANSLINKANYYIYGMPHYYIRERRDKDINYLSQLLKKEWFRS